MKATSILHRKNMQLRKLPIWLRKLYIWFKMWIQIRLQFLLFQLLLSLVLLLLAITCVTPCNTKKITIYGQHYVIKDKKKDPWLPVLPKVLQVFLWAPKEVGPRCHFCKKVIISQAHILQTVRNFDLLSETKLWLLS